MNKYKKRKKEKWVATFKPMVIAPRFNVKLESVTTESGDGRSGGVFMMIMT